MNIKNVMQKPYFLNLFLKSNPVHYNLLLKLNKTLSCSLIYRSYINLHMDVNGEKNLFLPIIY